ncbi:MAG: putative phage tail assembly protein [Xanthobacteraceae bacterium]|nr:MAG: putative phage tail assembly protein [Xanthobacteraceae bacterium]
MLAALGGVVFDIAPLNYDSLAVSATTSFASHAVPGAPKIYEHTGDDDRSITIKGKVFPEFSGGIGALSALEAMRASGDPQHLMLGSGYAAGWVIIKSVSQDHNHIGSGGVGREISFTLNLDRCDVPFLGGDLFGNLIDSILNAANEYL